jgi:hypothetical protein
MRFCVNRLSYDLGLFTQSLRIQTFGFANQSAQFATLLLRIAGNPDII